MASNEPTTYGTFVDHKFTKGGVDAQGVLQSGKHEFFFKAKEGLVSISIRSEKYLNALCSKYKVDEEDISALIEEFEKEPVPLFFENNEDYVGFTLMPSYQGNNFPHKRNSRVEILDVTYNDNGICFTLADETVANRSFSSKVGNEWYADIQKKMRFIKNLPMPVGMELDLVKPNFNSLKGMLMTYAIKEFNKSKYIDILNLEPGDPASEEEDEITL